jgi:predicted acylesterase/phospholipase RssA
MIIATPTDLMSPVHDTPEDAGSQPERGLALCLSGGGYRARVFHVGVLWRLNEVGLLPKLDRVSTVSGGPITSGVLATNWADLKFDEETEVATNLVDKFMHGDPVLPADPERTDQLAGLATRLAPMDAVDQEGLINCGYTVCDAGPRTHYLKDKLQGTPKTGLPYPEQVLS